ncbi:MAG: 2-oxoacid:acceptor oxidoreductase subunit alpha [Flavobacteriales bacterium]|nr:2-oxoacid:acceptor oxidoreductase subunit alpha [Flavobacteriales bacterium]
MKTTPQETKEITILFAGDSGDGMQLTGNQFANTNAFFGNDLATFPNFPAEIRAPIGTVAGVSGFQMKFGSTEIYTPGDQCNVLVAMNAAGLKSSLHNVEPQGTIIINTSGFDKKNLNLAKYNSNPLEDGTLANFRVQLIDISKLTQETLKDSDLGRKETERSKNMFVLGYLYWMFNRNMEGTERFLKLKFGRKPDILDANLKVLKAGYHYGDTTETFTSRYEVKKASLPKGTYRSIMGNQATAIGLIAAAQKAGLQLFYGSYPITPASDILHELAKHKNFGVKTFQAEDEIAAVTACIGAAFGGALATTGSSGPGIAIKGEALGLAVMLEIPLVVVNVQRGGPSTGLPTKTEQSDLMQALFGRNGEAQTVVVAPKTPKDAFETAFEACRLAIEHMVPVMMLSDGYIANGSEPWAFPNSKDLKPIVPQIARAKDYETEPYLPYKRDDNLVRKWAVPGTPGLEHRLGGLEKQDITGDVSYDPDNHQHMVKTRAAKIDRIALSIPLQTIDQGAEKGKLLILAWGSPYGAIKTAVKRLLEQGYDVSHAHLRYLNPFPRNLGDVVKNFDMVLIPEINDGQLDILIRNKFLIPTIRLCKIKGMPFTANEIIEKVKEIYE